MASNKKRKGEKNIFVTVIKILIVIFLFLIIWYNEKHKTKVSRE